MGMAGQISAWSSSLQLCSRAPHLSQSIMAHPWTLAHLTATQPEQCALHQSPPPRCNVPGVLIGARG